MNITQIIRTTGNVIVTYLKEKGKDSIRIIAKATNISKSAVHRHLQARNRWHKYPESYFWDMPEGEVWLRRMIFSTLFLFGLKCNVGAETISAHFKQIRIDTHVGISPSGVRKLLRQMQSFLLEFQAIHEAFMANTMDKPLHIIAIADETFFHDLLMLVMMDLSSGYLILEKIADDRTFKTWLEATIVRLNYTNIKVDQVITDRAKALIKLADELECDSGGDLFHGQQSLSRSLGKPLKSLYEKVCKSLIKENKKLKKLFKRDLNDVKESRQMDKCQAIKKQKLNLIMQFTITR